ncbi:MAG: SRPBCC family protein [Acidimicrobiia bacterium]
MATVVPRTLDWIPRAPVRAHGAATSAAPPEVVFAVLADHERWVEWFPNLKRVDVLGPAAGVGARRRVKIPMVTVEEEFIAWEPGVRWAFTATSTSPAWTRSLIEDCQLTARPDGGTGIDYTMYLDPVGPIGWIMKRSVGRISSAIQQGMENLAARAATAA